MGELIWRYCPECRYKVFRASGDGMDIEIKCHSCKAVILFLASGGLRVVEQARRLKN